MTKDSSPKFKIEEPEVMEYETQDILKGVRVKLEDGSILDVMLEVTSIMKMGYDINSGAPIYNVNTQTVVKIKSMPREVFKKEN